MNLKRLSFGYLFLFFCSPLIIFLTNPKNFVQLNLSDIFYVLISIVLIFSISLILSLIIKSFLINQNFFADRMDGTTLTLKILFCISIIFFQMFWHESLREAIYIQGLLRRPFLYYSIFLIFLINLFTIYLFIKYPKITIKIFTNFIIILIIFNIINHYKSYKNILISKNSNFEKNIKTIFPKNGLKNNIYYVVLDAMSDMEIFEKNYQKINQDQIKELFEKHDLEILENSTSSYNMTYLTMSSIIYANYPVTSKSKIQTRNIFFPNMIYYLDKNNLGIISYLMKNNNEFKFIGNVEYNLNINKNFDIGINDKNLLSNIQNKMFPNIFFKFYKPTPIDELIRLLIKLSFKNNENFEEYYLNDGVGRYLKFLKKNGPPIKKSFILIHHFSPHDPFIYDKNCKKVEHNENEKKGYIDAYKCALKKIIELTKYINKIDPNAFIVFQGDHGSSVIDHKTPDRFKIFNALKKNKFCKNKIMSKNNINTVDVVRFSIYCSTGYKMKKIETQNYIGYYEDESRYGTIDKIKIY